MVAEPDKVLVGELNVWVANPLGPGQTSALQIVVVFVWLLVGLNKSQWDKISLSTLSGTK